jgi:PKD repeat protein
VRTASDITGSGDYVVIDNATCKVNRPPTAELFATPLSGYAPLNVSFDASHSADADGDTIASYTFNFGDGSPEVTQASPAASHTFAAPGNYNTVLTVTDATGTRSTNVANAVIEVREPPQTTVVEDDDSRIAYSDGWHLGTGSGSANHFRYHTGTIPTDSAVLDFSVPQGKTGSITYYFARSAKGGTGQVYLDGVLAAEVNCQSPTGSLQSPEFSDDYKVSLDGLAAGAHRLEIRNMSDAVYVDRFVLVSGSSAAQPANGPGQTANQTDSATAGQTVLGRYQAPSNMTGLSVVVESSLNNVPFQLALVSPSGLTLKTAAASKGVAAVEMPVTQGGTYVVRVVNLSVGPLKFKTAITPTVRR